MFLLCTIQWCFLCLMVFFSKKMHVFVLRKRNLKNCQRFHCCFMVQNLWKQQRKCFTDWKNNNRSCSITFLLVYGKFDQEQRKRIQDFFARVQICVITLCLWFLSLCGWGVLCATKQHGISGSKTGVTLIMRSPLNLLLQWVSTPEELICTVSAFCSFQVFSQKLRSQEPPVQVRQTEVGQKYTWTNVKVRNNDWKMGNRRKRSC